MAQPLTKGEIERRLFNAEQALAPHSAGKTPKRSGRAGHGSIITNAA